MSRVLLDQLVRRLHERGSAHQPDAPGSPVSCRRDPSITARPAVFDQPVLEEVRDVAVDNRVLGSAVPLVPEEDLVAVLVPQRHQLASVRKVLQNVIEVPLFPQPVLVLILVLILVLVLILILIII